MSENQFSVKSCPTCNGSGFVWRGIAMKHETIFMCQGKPAVHIHVSRIKNLVPGCRCRRNTNGIRSPVLNYVIVSKQR